MLSHSPDLAANILKSRAPEKRCYRCLRAAFFNGCVARGADTLPLNNPETHPDNTRANWSLQTDQAPLPAIGRGRPHGFAMGLGR